MKQLNDYYFNKTGEEKANINQERLLLTYLPAPTHRSYTASDFQTASPQAASWNVRNVWLSIPTSKYEAYQTIRLLQIQLLQKSLLGSNC